MNSLSKIVKKLELSEKKRSKSFLPEATRDEIERALTEYLAKGGKITRIEPEWIDEDEIYIFDSHYN